MRFGGVETDRAEHLAWCKKRALDYVKTGDLVSAWASMCSDLQKHPETENHAAIQLGMMLVMSGQLSTAPEMKKFIEGVINAEVESWGYPREEILKVVKSYFVKYPIVGVIHGDPIAATGVVS